MLGITNHSFKHSRLQVTTIIQHRLDTVKRSNSVTAFEFYLIFSYCVAFVCFVSVCNRCKEASPAPYALISQTTALQNYLVTRSHLDRLPYLLTKNPHKSSYSNMKLYLKQHVLHEAKLIFGEENYLEKIEEAKKQKEINKLEKIEKRKTKQRKKAETIKTTKSSKQQQETVHTHNFITTKDGKEKCGECGFVVEFEEF